MGEMATAPPAVSTTASLTAATGPPRAARRTPLVLRIVTGSHVRATAAGGLTLRLSCLGGEPSGYRCKLSLKSARKVPSRYLGRGRSRVVSFGTRPFTLHSGAGAAVIVRLSTDNLALLRRMQTIRVIAQATATDRAGHVTTVSRMLSLHAPRRRRACSGGVSGSTARPPRGRVDDRDEHGPEADDHPLRSAPAGESGDP